MPKEFLLNPYEEQVRSNNRAIQDIYDSITGGAYAYIPPPDTGGGDDGGGEDITSRRLEVRFMNTGVRTANYATHGYTFISGGKDSSSLPDSDRSYYWQQIETTSGTSGASHTYIHVRLLEGDGTPAFIDESVSVRLTFSGSAVFGHPVAIQSEAAANSDYTLNQLFYAEGGQDITSTTRLSPTAPEWLSPAGISLTLYPDTTYGNIPSKVLDMQNIHFYHGTNSNDPMGTVVVSGDTWESIDGRNRDLTIRAEATTEAGVLPSTKNLNFHYGSSVPSEYSQGLRFEVHALQNGTPILNIPHDADIVFSVSVVNSNGEIIPQSENVIVRLQVASPDTTDTDYNFTLTGTILPSNNGTINFSPRDFGFIPGVPLGSTARVNLSVGTSSVSPIMNIEDASRQYVVYESPHQGDDLVMGLVLRIGRVSTQAGTFPSTTGETNGLLDEPNNNRYRIVPSLYYSVSGGLSASNLGSYNSNNNNYTLSSTIESRIRPYLFINNPDHPETSPDFLPETIYEYAIALNGEGLTSGNVDTLGGSDSDYGKIRITASYTFDTFEQLYIRGASFEFVNNINRFRFKSGDPNILQGHLSSSIPEDILGFPLMEEVFTMYRNPIVPIEVNTSSNNQPYPPRMRAVSPDLQRIDNPILYENGAEGGSPFLRFEYQIQSPDTSTLVVSNKDLNHTTIVGTNLRQAEEDEIYIRDYPSLGGNCERLYGYVYARPSVLPEGTEIATFEADNHLGKYKITTSIPVIDHPIAVNTPFISYKFYEWDGTFPYSNANLTEIHGQPTFSLADFPIAFTSSDYIILRLSIINSEGINSNPFSGSFMFTAADTAENTDATEGQEANLSLTGHNDTQRLYSSFDEYHTWPPSADHRDIFVKIIRARTSAGATNYNLFVNTGSVLILGFTHQTRLVWVE